MNILLIILGVIGVLAAIVLIAALFVKKEYTIEEEITINCPKPEVFEYLRYLKNQDNYNKWVMADPEMQKNYTGNDGTEGFIYAWDSENKQVGAGEMEIRRVAPGDRIEIEIRFERPFKGISQCYLETADESNGKTHITWGFESSMKYPMNIMLALLNLEKMLANDLQASLGNLKNLLETKAVQQQ